MAALPKEIWLYIFNHLGSEALKSVQLVNTAFAEWLTDDIFWFKKCKAGMLYVLVLVLVCCW